MNRLGEHGRTVMEEELAAGRFHDHYTKLRDHDVTCTSVNHVWLPRRGGVSCLQDLGDCVLCELTFFWDGGLYFEELPSGAEMWLCECCTRDGGLERGRVEAQRQWDDE